MSAPVSASLESQRPPLDEENPWPGLDSFRESDQRFFRGRSQEVRELQALIGRSRISVLYGASGIGKSSLLQAGLVPLLREDGSLPIRVRLDFSAHAPDPITQIKRAILLQSKDAGIEAPPSDELASLWEYFHRRDQNFWDSRNRLVTPVLLFDQFEEVFTLGSPRGILSPAAREFMTQLSQLAEGHPPDELQEWLTQHPEDSAKFVFQRHYYRIVISMRDDYVARLDDFRGLIPSIAAHRQRLLAMDGSAALRAASQSPQLISPAVAERIVRFVAADETPERELTELTVDPALLSVMCSEFNERRKARGESNITANLLEGSRDEILRDFYHRAVAGIHPAVRSFLEERLIIDPGYRDTVAANLVPDVPGSRDDVDCLIRRRVIRAEQRGRVRRIEITHDLLVPVIRESRNKRRSEQQAENERTARLQAERSLRKTRLVVALFAAISVFAVSALIVARIAEHHATYNKQIAQDALEDLSDLAGSHSVEVPDEAPETLAFRQQLINHAKSIYNRFRKSDLNSEDLRRSAAIEHFRAGDLYRMRADPEAAIREYQTAIAALRDLVRDYPQQSQYARDLADAYLWLGETERPIPAHNSDAKTAFDSAVAVGLDLTRRFPSDETFREKLAETYDDRGILEQFIGLYPAAATDFRTAIGMLTPLSTPTAQRDLSNAKNNLARFLYKTAGPTPEAISLLDEAIAIGEKLVKADPGNAEFKLHLAEFNNNSAQLLADSNQALASERNRKAIDLTRDLAKPAFYLTARLGLFISTRAGMFNKRSDYEQAIALLRNATSQTEDRSFHIWLGEALTNFAESGSAPNPVELLQEAIQQQTQTGSKYDLVWDYCHLALECQKNKSTAAMQAALFNCRSLIGGLPPSDQTELRQLIKPLE